MDSVTRRQASEIDPWWAFAQAPRFWVMLAGIISIYLEKKGLIGQDEMTMIASISALFIAIKTFDRSVDKMTSK